MPYQKHVVDGYEYTFDESVDPDKILDPVRRARFQLLYEKCSAEEADKYSHGWYNKVINWLLGI